MSVTLNIIAGLFVFAWTALPVIAVACGISAASAWRDHEYGYALMNAAGMVAIFLLGYAVSGMVVDVITWMMS